MARCSVVLALAAVAVAVGVVVAKRVFNPPLPSVEEVDLSGKVVVITGGTGGVGYEAARILATWGAHVIIGARNASKARSKVDAIRASTTREVQVEAWPLDLSSLEAVHAFAQRFQESHLPLHVLVNNAGIAGLWNETRTRDGFEVTFQVNHLSHFLLTGLLLDALKASKPSRVLSVSSDLHTQGRLDFQNLDSERAYDRFSVYQNTKLYNVLFANELNRRLHGTGVVSNSLHPGFVDTDLASGMPPLFDAILRLGRAAIARTPVEGAMTTVYAAASPAAAATGGVYFDTCKPAPQGYLATRKDYANRLWRASCSHLRAAGRDYGICP